ncbi:MAG: ATP-binding cassette domain-containing protein [Nitrospinota bacterium]|nr:ATP-binding cassette domain-containing protein [Nitrospinota bacterium]MDH5678665.1 ATP-binding cassette domain-containing protein [Nitrospinota bacterium]MDH5757803.1 ATP-binding cassette domain-containing protein [Nitrospinota bacterium]
MNDDVLISCQGLRREFTVAEGRAGLLGSIKSLFSNKTSVIRAVDDISFDIRAGEFVGYVGENGAGKSTTIKMLTGILTPTGGRALVNGVVPYEERVKNAFNIGVVFGQRSQLWWDLPMSDSLDLLRAIYRVPQARYHESLAELSDWLELGPLMKMPVRKLSLGQRMRADLAASLLHGPKVMFLDEPTIGLDIIAKDNVRRFLKKINKERGVTIILTTHDMDDIEALCDRIIIIDKGKIAWDGATARLKSDHMQGKILEVEFHDYNPKIHEAVGLTEMKSEANKKWLRYRGDGGAALNEVISALFRDYCVKDLSIHEPKVADVVKAIYQHGAEVGEDGGA